MRKRGRGGRESRGWEGRVSTAGEGERRRREDLSIPHQIGNFNTMHS